MISFVLGHCLVMGVAAFTFLPQERIDGGLFLGLGGCITRMYELVIDVEDAG